MATVTINGKEIPAILIDGKAVPIQVTQGQNTMTVIGAIYDHNAETPFIAIEIE